MSAARLVSFRNRWFSWAVGGVAAMAVAAMLVGFIWLPSRHPDISADGLWATICRAAGAPARWYSGPTPTSGRTPTDFVMDASLFRGVDAAEIGRGATLAMQCSMCHGARGISGASFPNLAGQYPEVIYKQLRDFKDGHRQSAVMEALAKGLSDDDMRSLASFYAYLPRPTLAAMSEGRQDVPPLVRVGDPLRNIVACIACHGGVDHKVGSPWLEGAPADYLRTQLENFARGVRTNDINEQMRNVARHLTDAEMTQIADYYSARPDKPPSPGGNATPPR